MVPGLDSGNLASQLQASPELKGMPIVFLTAAVTREVVRAHHGLVGGPPLLAKPVNLREVLACLEQHLGALQALVASSRSEEDFGRAEAEFCLRCRRPASA